MKEKNVPVMGAGGVIGFLLGCLVIMVPFLPLGCTALQMNTLSSATSTVDAELPEWTIGDSWTYSMSVQGIRGEPLIPG